MHKIIKKCLALSLLALLVSSNLFMISAEDKEKTPAPKTINLNASQALRWTLPVEYLEKPDYSEKNLYFRIYFKDKWSGESYKYITQCKGWDHDSFSCRLVSIRLRDASDEEDPQVTEEKKNGKTYISIPVVSGHKYKVAIKMLDKEVGVWSDITTQEYYFMSKAEVTWPDVYVDPKEGGISIQWKPVEGATKYIIERHIVEDPSGKMPYPIIKDTFRVVGNDQTTFFDDTVKNGYSYIYYFSAGRGEWVSAQVSSGFITFMSLE